MYWQFGWWGVVVGCPLIGVLLGWLTKNSIEAVETRELLLFPLVLLSIRFAIQNPNKFLANGVIGFLPIYLGYFFMIKMVIGSIRGKQKDSRSDYSGFPNRNP